MNNHRLWSAASLLPACVLALWLTHSSTPLTTPGKPAAAQPPVKRPHLLRRLLGIEKPAGLLARHKTPVQTTPPDFRALHGKARKAAFVRFMKPLIERANEAVRAQRQHLLVLYQRRHRLTAAEIAWLKQLAAEYDLKTFDPHQPRDWQTLLRRVDTVPVSLALAQAADESGWGTSRFARQGNNYFGIWCYTPGCGIPPAHPQKGGGYYAVKRYASPYDAVRDYIHLLNTGRAFRPLRRLRAQLRASGQPVTGEALAATLHHYSQRGDAYPEELIAMIRHNKWHRLDSTL